MWNNSYGLNRLVNRYVKMFNNDHDAIIKEKDFHIEQIQIAIDAADEILDLNADKIAGWADCIQELYEEFEDPDTIWNRIQIKAMRWYVNWQYAMVLDEAVRVGKARENLQAILNRILILSAGY